MRRITSALAATAAAVLLTSTIAAAQAVDNRLTNVTFSAPVTVPGHTLKAGTYHFQLMDSNTDRNIVQIFDKDQHLVATLMAIPAKRNQPEGDPLITFKETRSDQPPAVHYWYYAGESSGNELVYPKSQAMEIARASGESVMSTDTDSTDISGLRNSKITRVTPDEANAQPQPTTAPATTTTQPDTTTAPQQPTTQPRTPVTTAPTTPTTTAEQPTRPTTVPDANQNPTQPKAVATSGRALPHTASNLPEVGLIGLIAFSAGLGVRFARKSLV